MKLRPTSLLILPIVQDHIKILHRAKGWALLILVVQFTIRYHGVTEEQEGVYSGLFRFWLALLVISTSLTWLSSRQKETDS